jgi:hypothetical protein
LYEWKNFTELRYRDAPLNLDDSPLNGFTAALLSISLVGLILADAFERLIEMVSFDIESRGYVIEIVPLAVAEFLYQLMSDLGPAGAADGERNS